ncbi:c-type cytochrome [Microvirga sp. M2]|uniref:c-type cytochrome n=1 Tax=Microvirga sp. M2 TaxID=3073270 RepID=UPI0039C47A18
MDWKLLIGYSVAGIAALSHAGLTSGSDRRASRHTSSKQVAVSRGSPAAPAASPTRPAVSAATAQSSAAGDEWIVADVDKLADDAWGRAVRLGRDLTVATYAHLGPEVADAGKRYAGNNLACQSCHLDAGTKKFGLPFVGVFGDFPQYRSREGEVGTIEDRVNGCMTRSMNGKPLPVDSTEMKAFVAYIKFVSTGRPIGGKTEGRGSGNIPELTRAASLEHGQEVYAQACAACHQADGQGVRKGIAGDAQGYQFPPLWGPDSFNDGAGMNRLISAANFIHGNMPLGTTYDAPVLSAEDAWDVAAFIQSQSRPAKADLDKDFPNRMQKPVDAGYGPYIDGFDREQHRLGPFGPIRDKIKALKESEAGKAPAN